jgi:hypothetical protein
VIVDIVIVRVFAIESVGTSREPLLNNDGNILINGARVGLFFLDPKVRQQFENLVWLDFQLSRQLIDSDFLLHN